MRIRRFHSQKIWGILFVGFLLGVTPLFAEEPPVIAETATAVEAVTAGAGEPLSVRPFESGAEITLEVKESGNQKVRILDAKGKTVSLLHEGFLPAGRHTLIWNSGVNTPTSRYEAEISKDGSSPLRQSFFYKKPRLHPSKSIWKSPNP